MSEDSFSSQIHGDVIQEPLEVSIVRIFLHRKARKLLHFVFNRFLQEHVELIALRTLVRSTFCSQHVVVVALASVNSQRIFEFSQVSLIWTCLHTLQLFEIHLQILKLRNFCQPLFESSDFVSNEVGFQVILPFLVSFADGNAYLQNEEVQLSVPTEVGVREGFWLVFLPGTVDHINIFTLFCDYGDLALDTMLVFEQLAQVFEFGLQRHHLIFQLFLGVWIDFLDGGGPRVSCNDDVDGILVIVLMIL